MSPPSQQSCMACCSDSSLVPNLAKTVGGVFVLLQSHCYHTAYCLFMSSSKPSYSTWDKQEGVLYLLLEYAEMDLNAVIRNVTHHRMATAIYFWNEMLQVVKVKGFYIYLTCTCTPAMGVTSVSSNQET